MIYISLFIIIAILTLKSGILNQKNKFEFIILTIILIFMSMFRYGSGTDYFAYMWHYNINPSNIMESINYKEGMNIGYRTLMGISKALDIKFEGFILVLSVIVMWLFISTIIKNSNYLMLSLMIFYGFYYPIYVNSALRQGIAMAIFIWSFFKYYKNGKKRKYIIMIIFASLFHESVLITLLVPIFNRLYNKYFKRKDINIVLFMIGIVSFIFKGDRLLIIIGNLIGIMIEYESTRANFMAIILRIMLLIIIIILYKYCDKKNLTEFDKLCIYIYFINVILFISLSNMPILSRLTEYFSLLDIFILAKLLRQMKLKHLRDISILIIIMITTVVFIKDQYSFIQQAGYYNKKVTSYPYITVFNKEKIYSSRRIPEVIKLRE